MHTLFNIDVFCFYMACNQIVYGTAAEYRTCMNGGGGRRFEHSASRNGSKGNRFRRQHSYIYILKSLCVICVHESEDPLGAVRSFYIVCTHARAYTAGRNINYCSRDVCTRRASAADGFDTSFSYIRLLHELGNAAATSLHSGFLLQV